MSRINGYQEVTTQMMAEKLNDAMEALRNDRTLVFAEDALKAALAIFPDFRATRMQNALERFVKAGYALSDAWYAPASNNYPLYMPDFQSFLVDFSEVMEEPDPFMASPVLSVTLPIETETTMLEAIKADFEAVIEKYNMEIVAQVELRTDAQRVKE